MEPIEEGKFTIFSEFLNNLKFQFFIKKTKFFMLNSDKNSVITLKGYILWFSNQFEPVGFVSMQSEVKKIIF